MSEQNQSTGCTNCAGCANCDNTETEGRPAVRIAVVGRGCDMASAVAMMSERLGRAAEMVEAGLDPHEAADRNGLSYDVLVATGIVEQGPDEFVVPVKYEVEGYIVVKAMTAADAIIAAGQSEASELTLEEPEIVDGSVCVCGDRELVDVYSGLYRKNAFKHPVTRTAVVSGAAKAYAQKKLPCDASENGPDETGHAENPDQNDDSSGDTGAGETKEVT